MRSEMVIGRHGGSGLTHAQPSPEKERLSTLQLQPHVPPGHTHLHTTHRLTRHATQRTRILSIQELLVQCADFFPIPLILSRPTSASSLAENFNWVVARCWYVVMYLFCQCKVCSPFFRVWTHAAAAVEARGGGAGLRLVVVTLESSGETRRDQRRNVRVHHLSEKKTEELRVCITVLCRLNESTACYTKSV